MNNRAKRIRPKVTMGFRRVIVGVLSALIACSAVAVAKAAEDDKSYLPPSSIQSKIETATDHHSMRRSGVRHREKRIKLVHHRRHARERYAYRRYGRQRYAYYNPGLAFQRFFFGLFH